MRHIAVPFDYTDHTASVEWDSPSFIRDYFPLKGEDLAHFSFLFFLFSLSFLFLLSPPQKIDSFCRLLCYLVGVSSLRTRATRPPIS
ncbi:hypothetical protein BDV23DRAFT_23132 [Aspergillus alliaceus]|uniref:Uncharacterized protein n=1 Tax=Petromyces alliaceus TaxID=209559 RepID=A0A5N7CIR1_PETAA|nr:hypothetical protein BDV23DRAFT_23132 [Aspergillus alliaceus]